jgi:hypothetical protein
VPAPLGFGLDFRLCCHHRIRRFCVTSWVCDFLGIRELQAAKPLIGHRQPANSRRCRDFYYLEGHTSRVCTLRYCASGRTIFPVTSCNGADRLALCFK